jgi:hypothetical protein
MGNITETTDTENTDNMESTKITTPLKPEERPGKKTFIMFYIPKAISKCLSSEVAHIVNSLVHTIYPILFLFF